jgi:rod shape-determining protein MreD
VSPALPQLVLRLSLLGFAVAILQVAAVSQITIFGINADLLPLTCAAVGLLCGSLWGALFGFGTGLLVDAALIQTMGLSSLCYLTAGYAAGRVRELRDPQGALVPVAVGAIATALVSFGYSGINFLLGQEAPVSFLLLGQTLVVVAVNAGVAIPVHAAVRRWLLAVLPEDPRRRRRRAYTTGGLSPLSNA